MESATVKRVDAAAKVAGSAPYLSDLSFPGMLYARTFRSILPRGIIRGIRVPSLPQGYFIVDCQDVVDTFVGGLSFFAREEVNYVGDPILLVVGPDRQTILDILRSIRVEYEAIPPILGIDDALSDRLPSILPDSNVYKDISMELGDLDKRDPKKIIVLTREYNTGLQEHVYLEPQGMVAVPENDGVAIYGALQWPFTVRKEVAQALQLLPEQVRVVQTVTGGGFGGREEYPSVLAAQAAAAAMKTGHPVKLLLERKEDMACTTKRHPSRIRITSLVDKESKRITGMEIEIILNGGAYCGMSVIVLHRALFSMPGVYEIPYLHIRGRALATNTPPAGAFRGFGTPQSLYAIEMNMDWLADELGVDPLEFRRRHMIKEGSLSGTGGVYKGRIKLEELIEKVTDASGYREKYLQYEEKRVFGEASPKRGVGICLFHHGCGFTGNGERDVLHSKVSLRKNQNGQFEILTSVGEIGQGAATVLRQIVAAVLGVVPESILYENPDTSRVPDSGPTVASRTVMIVGKLLEGAAWELLEHVNDTGEYTVSRDFVHPPTQVWDGTTFSGDAYDAYAYGANVAEVEVDPISSEVSLVGAWGAYDIGHPINIDIAREQMIGGIVQAAGMTLLETMDIDRQGIIRQKNISDYSPPTSMDIPNIHVDFVDNPYELGPQGAKCAGELPNVGMMAAIAAAVRHATGADLADLPITAERILSALKQEG